jgi:hypothetical protein
MLKKLFVVIIILIPVIAISGVNKGVMKKYSETTWEKTKWKKINKTQQYLGTSLYDSTHYVDIEYSEATDNWYMMHPFLMNDDSSAVRTYNDGYQKVGTAFISKNHITNKDYRAFIKYVNDSILRWKIALELPESELLIDSETWEERLNWKIKINQKEIAEAKLLESHKDVEFVDQEYKIKKDSLTFEYYLIDFRTASAKASRDTSKSDTTDSKTWSYGDRVSDRGDFIKRVLQKIYPANVWTNDTINNLTSQQRTWFQKEYLYNRIFDDYPVLGINEAQAKAFCSWITKMINNDRDRRGKIIVNDFRLPYGREQVAVDLLDKKQGKLVFDWTKEGIIVNNPSPVLLQGKMFRVIQTFLGRRR